MPPFGEFAKRGSWSGQAGYAGALERHEDTAGSDHLSSPQAWGPSTVPGVGHTGGSPVPVEMTDEDNVWTNGIETERKVRTANDRQNVCSPGWEGEAASEKCYTAPCRAAAPAPKGTSRRARGGSLQAQR